MLRLIGFGILAVVLVVALRLLRGSRKASPPSEPQPPPIEKPPDKEHKPL